MIEDKYIKVGQVNTRYLTLGHQGSSVILIHSLGASADMWKHNTGDLAKYHRVFAPDLVGFGRSDKPDIDYSPASLAHFVNDFMAALNIERASLIGLSLGGGIALQYTLLFPGKVEKLVLIGSAGLGKEVTWPPRLASIPFVGRFLFVPTRRGLALFMKRWVCDSAVITDDFFDLCYELCFQPGTRRALARILKTVCTIRGARKDIVIPILTKLETITAPTLIVWGQQDRVFPIAHAYFATEKIPNSRLCIFQQCGHMPNFEKPDEFNKLVLEFLAK